MMIPLQVIRALPFWHSNVSYQKHNKHSKNANNCQHSEKNHSFASCDFCWVVKFEEEKQVSNQQAEKQKNY